MENYINNIHASWLASLDEPDPQTRHLALIVYTAAVVFILFWISVGLGEKWFSHYLREGSPIDMLSTTFLGSSAALAGIAFTVGRNWRAQLFWLLCALACIFLMLDERLQVHEQVRDLFGGSSWGDAPFGMRNWNDLVMIVYGLGALILGLLTLPAFVRHRRVRTFLIIGFVFFVVHTLVDMSFETGPLKDVFEEPGKILAGASFLLAFLNAVFIELRHDVYTNWKSDTQQDVELTQVGFTSTSQKWRLSTGYCVVFLTIALIWTWLATEPTDDVRDLLWENWGYPHRWLTAVYLQLSAIVIVAAALLNNGKVSHFNWRSLPLAAGLWFLSIGEAMNATRYRFTHDRVDGDFLPSLRKELDVLHNDLEIIHWVVLAIMIAVFYIAKDTWRKHKSAYRWMQVGLLTLLVALVVNVVTDGMGGSIDDFGEDILSPALRVIGSACVALAGLSFLVSTTQDVYLHDQSISSRHDENKS